MSFDCLQLETNINFRISLAEPQNVSSAILKPFPHLLHVLICHKIHAGVLVGGDRLRVTDSRYAASHPGNVQPDHVTCQTWLKLNARSNRILGSFNSFAAACSSFSLLGAASTSMGAAAVAQSGRWVSLMSHENENELHRELKHQYQRKHLSWIWTWVWRSH